MNRIKSILDVPRHHLCTSCGGCVGVCPNAAVKLVPTLEGTLGPEVNADKCISCRICLNVCPGHEVNLQEFQRRIFHEVPAHPEMGNFLAIYSGHATDKQIQRSGQSGGVVTALLSHLIRVGKINGAVLTKWSNSDPLKPETYIARSHKECLDAVGSKYCPVPAASILRELATAEGKFVIVGVSCHVHAIRKAMDINSKIRNKIFAIFGLHCRGVLSNHFHDFILQKAGINPEEVKSFILRSKKWRGWPGDLQIVTHAGKVHNFPGSISRVGPRAYFTPWRCQVCPDKLNELSDVSFGDCRIPHIHDVDRAREMNYHHNPGQSDIICRSEKGLTVIEEAVKLCVLNLRPTHWREVLRTAKPSEKKLGLANRRITLRILGMAAPQFGVRYRLKNVRKLLLFKFLEPIALLPTIHSRMAHLILARSSFRRAMSKYPLPLMLYAGAVLKRLTNSSLFGQSELTVSCENISPIKLRGDTKVMEGSRVAATECKGSGETLRESNAHFE